MYELKDDPFYKMIYDHPDCSVDYCIMKSDEPYNGEESHLRALSFAMRKLCFPEGESEPVWDYNVRNAMAAPIDPEDLLFLPNTPRKTAGYYEDGPTAAYYDPETGGESIPYWKAFLYPPHGCSFTEKDFIELNALLFPNGTDHLSVYDWTTDWSGYFDDGREWWGSLCISVYDRSLDRYVVITASATD